MRQRRTYVIVGALGLAALAGLFGCGRAGSSHSGAIRATPVSATITVDSNNNVTFAPPPADAAPAMTAEQAWANMDNTSIASDTAVQLGLLTGGSDRTAGPNARTATLPKAAWCTRR
jgi:hypothetical protein